MRQLLATLGKLISSAGSERFEAQMHELLAKHIQFEFVAISEWTVDECAQKVAGVRLLGISGARLLDEPGVAPPVVSLLQDDAEHSLPNRILTAPDHAQSIHLYAPPLWRVSRRVEAPAQPENCFQCHLVSRQPEYRYVTSLYREPRQADFSLQEMLMLGSFSTMILPLVESHAATLSNTAYSNRTAARLRQKRYRSLRHCVKNSSDA